jgi:hypothetical protein
MTEKNYDPIKDFPTSYEYLDHFYFSVPETGKLYAKRDIVMARRTIKKNEEVGNLGSSYVYVYLPNKTTRRRSDINYILKTKQNLDKDVHVDNLDENKLNDSWSNIDIRQVYKPNRKYPKGVNPTNSNKFRARFYHKGITYEFGVFLTVEEATKAYQNGKANVLEKLYNQTPIVTYSKKQEYVDYINKQSENIMVPKNPIHTPCDPIVTDIVKPKRKYIKKQNFFQKLIYNIKKKS